MEPTNPGSTNPGGDAPKPVHPGPYPGPGAQWPSDAARLNAPDDSGSGGDVSTAAIKAGHEPDVFYVKPILSIPLAVVVAFVVAFGVCAIVFGIVMVSPTDPMAHPAAVKESELPLNEQMAQVDRVGENANPYVKVDNSRNEANQLLEDNGQTITRLPLQNGYNSPILHAEDVNPSLRPEKVPALTTAAPGTVTIDKALTEAAGDKKNNVLPVRKDASKPVKSDAKPTGANAGRGPSPRAPKLPEAPASVADPKAGPMPKPGMNPMPPGPGPTPPPPKQPVKVPAKP